MKKFLGIAVVLALFASLGLTGCKNVCDKAVDHFIGCIDEFCGDNEDNPICAEEALNELKEEAGGAEMECTEENKEEAQEMLDTSCEELTAIFALAGAFAPPADEEGE